MIRSHRLLALCALLGAAAWTNAQAMTCCWPQAARAAHPAATSEARSEAGSGTENTKTGSSSCHGSMDDSGRAEQAETPSNSKLPSSPCQDAYASPESAGRLAACCEAFAPAESFAAAPVFIPDAVEAFIARVSPTPPILRQPGDPAHGGPPRDPPRFLSERLIV